MGKGKTGNAEPGRLLCLVDAGDLAALRREALSRVERGEARRVSVSALVREALAAAPWRREAPR